MIIEDAENQEPSDIDAKSHTSRHVLQQQRILPSSSRLNTSSLKGQPGDDHPRLGFEVAQVTLYREHLANSVHATYRGACCHATMRSMLPWSLWALWFLILLASPQVKELTSGCHQGLQFCFCCCCACCVCVDMCV